MKRRSNTKPPHDPHILFLDEDTSGDTFVSLLKQARVSVQPYETLLPKNKKIPDATVIERCAKANYVLVTTDKRMESEWIEDIIQHKARVIRLTDDDGGPIHWAAALICSKSKWSRVLLDQPNTPVIIRVERSGIITRIVGEADLLKRRDQLLTASIVRGKKHGRQPVATKPA